MDIALYILIALMAGAGLGALVAWRAASRQAKASAEERESAYQQSAQERESALRQSAEEKSARIGELEKELGRISGEKEASVKEAALLQGQLSSLKKAQTELGAQMRNEFSSIAQELLHKNSQKFAESSQERIKGLLEPFGHNIDSFRKRVNEVHDASTRNHASLRENVKQVLDAGKLMSDEAEQLSRALRGNKQVLGAWGEMQLETTLQAAGMVEGEHYDRQESYRDSGNQMRRLDFIVNLPKGKHIIIDAKATINSYVDMVGAESEEGRAAAQNEFFEAIASHVDVLSGKDYHKLDGLDTPMYVLMYIPLESAYLMLLRSNMKIFDEAYRKNIVLVSHTTLLPVLRTISNLWVLEKSSRNARDILDQAGGLYRQLLLIADRLSVLGRRINSASDSYNEVITAFEGRQGMVAKVGKFRELSDKSREEARELQPIKTQCEDVKTAPAAAGAAGMTGHARADRENETDVFAQLDGPKETEGAAQPKSAIGGASERISAAPD